MSLWVHKVLEAVICLNTHIIHSMCGILVHKEAVRTPDITHTTPLLLTLHWLPVADPIQFISLVICLPCCKEIRPILHPGQGQTIHPSPSISVCDFQTVCYSLTVMGPELLLNRILIVCCLGSTIMEGTHH